MTATPWLVWLHQTDVSTFQNAYPHAQFVRQDHCEPEMVVYRVTLDIQPSPITFPLTDGAYWNHVHGGYTIATNPEQAVVDVRTHWHQQLDQVTPSGAASDPPPNAITWHIDQWIVTDDGSGPTIRKAITPSWDEADDLYEVRVFDAKDTAMDWLYERANFYREQEEPPYDEEANDDWDDEGTHINDDGDNPTEKHQ